ncbi:MAG: pentapeptide repeat-containing protein [Iphinoe sp. HA4291-MV1]|jgi:uncharacterized protein YjbI with pentapeptide repeats|nr:pentapeptide repeat-containing protein [Iphinoe sp. HA4291-MV1]
MPQDYSHRNLRGRSFKGQNLEGANFSYADIRSADFSGANLRGANFSHAKAGLQKRWATFLVLVSWLLSGISGFLLSIVGALITYALAYYSQNQITVWITLIVLIALVVILRVVLRRGLSIIATITGVGFFTAAIIVAFISSFAFITFVFAAGTIANERILLSFIFAFVTAIAVTLAGVVTVCGVLTGSIAGVIAEIVAGTGTHVSTAVIIFASTCASSFAVSFAVIGAINFIGNTGVDSDFPMIFGEVFILIGAFAVALISTYIARQAIKGKEKYALINNAAIRFTTFKGTSFRNTDLTDANFTQATLKSTDFRKANLTRTCFHNTKKLDQVRPGATYLQKTQVRQVLVKGEGQEKNFDRENLRGVNFQGANLVDANFRGADLSEANLQDADLSRAKLVQTQLDGTDFTGATLTGAYIEDWGITSDTKFDGVRCSYVYMRLPTKENPDPLHKPDNRQEVFADGEFGDFIKPIVDTLDLYHNQGVDPRASAISFKQLAENHPDAELRIVGMEVRGEDKFLLRAKTTPEADKSQLSAEYFEIYNELKALAEKELQKLIAEKDSRISSLENMVVTALQHPSFYSSTQIDKVDNMHPNQGGISQNVSDSQIDGGLQAVQGNQNQQNMKNKTSNFNLQNAQFAGGLVDADTVHAHQIGGNINNYTPPQQKQNLAEAAAEIQQLLQQLEQTNPTTTTSEKMTVVAKAINEIEKNPTLKARVIGALKSGGKEALKEAVDHPLVNILMASIEGWQEAE